MKAKIKSLAMFSFVATLLLITNPVLAQGAPVRGVSEAPALTLQDFVLQNGVSNVATTEIVSNVVVNGNDWTDVTIHQYPDGTIVATGPLSKGNRAIAGTHHGLELESLTRGGSMPTVSAGTSHSFSGTARAGNALFTNRSITGSGSFRATINNHLAAGTNLRAERIESRSGLIFNSWEVLNTWNIPGNSWVSVSVNSGNVNSSAAQILRFSGFTNNFVGAAVHTSGTMSVH